MPSKAQPAQMAANAEGTRNAWHDCASRPSIIIAPAAHEWGIKGDESRLLAGHRPKHIIRQNQKLKACNFAGDKLHAAKEAGAVRTAVQQQCSDDKD